VHDKDCGHPSTVLCVCDTIIFLYFVFQASAEFDSQKTRLETVIYRCHCVMITEIVKRTDDGVHPCFLRGQERRRHLVCSQ